MPADSLIDILTDLIDPTATNPWLVKNVDMVVRVLVGLYLVTLGVLVWSFTRRATPRDDGTKQRAEEQAKAITNLEAQQEKDRKRRQDLEADIEKIKGQLEEQKLRYEKQVDDLLARNRTIIREASETAAKAQEDSKTAIASLQQQVEGAKAREAELLAMNAALEKAKAMLEKAESTREKSEAVREKFEAELKAISEKSAAALAQVKAGQEKAEAALEELKTELAAERVKTKKAIEERDKEKERAGKFEGQCDRAQKEIDSLNQQMLKMINESQASESAGSEAAANSTFLEDLEKSLEADNDDTTALPKAYVADLHDQLGLTGDDAVAASAALEALERALSGGDSDEDQPSQDAVADDPNFVPPPPIPLPDAASIPSIMKKEKRRISARRVSFGGANAPEAPAAAGSAHPNAQEEQEPVTAVTLLKGYGVKADINRAGQRARGRRGGGTKEMEDENLCAFPFIDEQRALFCVFDGHAGRDCATDAKKFFPLEMASALQNHLNDKEVGALLKAVFLSTDDKLKHHEYMGCTATAVYVWAVGTERFLQCANVGDSTAFLCRNGTAVPLSFDHKVTQQSEKERVRAMGIEVSDTQGRLSGLAISRALGDHFTKVERTGIIGEPTVSPVFALTAADTLLIVASDGLWDVMSGQEACDFVRDIGECEEAASALITTAIGKGTQDNITVIVARL